MLEYGIISLAVTLGATALAAATRRELLTRVYILRALVAAPLAAIGVSVVVFVTDGFGWGWPDPSPMFILVAVTCAGIGIGFLHAGFAWFASQYLHWPMASAMLVLDPIVLFIPAGEPMHRIVALGAANFLLTYVWLIKGPIRQRVV